MSRSANLLFDDRTLLQIAVADLSIERAQRAWEMLQARHSSTRVLIESLDGGPCQRLVPLLGARAMDLSLDSQMVDRCRTETDLAWGLNVRLFDVIGSTVAHWTAAGISSTAFKGLGLIGDVYPEHRLRHVGDADVLIESENVRPALDSLLRSGWQVPWRGSDRLRFGATALAIRHPTGVGLDLHLRPARNIPYQRPPATWTTEAVPGTHPLAASGLRRVTADVHLLIVCAHNARPENAHLAHPLVDLYRLVVSTASTRAVSPDDLAPLARRFHLEYRCSEVMRHLSKVFDHVELGDFARARFTDEPSQEEQRAVEAELRRARHLEKPPGTNSGVRATIRRVRDTVTVTTVGQPRARRWTQIMSYFWQKTLLFADSSRTRHNPHQVPPAP